MSGSKIDLVLYGASGFTGRLVAEYVAKKRPALTVGLAGRNQEKLKAIQAELAKESPWVAEWPVLQADSSDPGSLDRVAAGARVICTTVGPYASYGTPVVEACVKHGISYCDLTGETLWMRHTIDTFHAEAERTGARIVHTCGFDSIPSDLGVWMMYRHASEKLGHKLREVRFRVAKAKGGVSGGTVASAIGMMKEIGDPAVRRVLGNPYALNPEGSPRGSDRGDAMTPHFDPDLKRWTAPFIMAAVNTRVVRRSNALLDRAYGENFGYEEAVATGKGVGGWLSAWGMSLGVGLGSGALAFAPTRAIAKLFLPGPGEGPSKEAREAGFFEIRLVGITEPPAGSEPIRLLGRVRGEQDPGYGETAKMLGESAMCLSQDDLPSRTGVLTPATAMGDLLLARLRAAGMTFEVEELREP